MSIACSNLIRPFAQSDLQPSTPGKVLALMPHYNLWNSEMGMPVTEIACNRHSTLLPSNDNLGPSSIRIKKASANVGNTRPAGSDYHTHSSFDQDYLHQPVLRTGTEVPISYNHRISITTGVKSDTSLPRKDRPASLEDSASVSDQERPSCRNSTYVEDKSRDQCADGARPTSITRPIGGIHTKDSKQKRDSTSKKPTSSRRGSPLHNSQVSRARCQIAQISNAAGLGSLPSHDIGQTGQLRTPHIPASRDIVVEAQQKRKEWTPNRSPLQHLESQLSDINNKEKRAYIEQAEQRLRAPKTEARSDQGSHVPAGRCSQSHHTASIPNAARSSRLSSHCQPEICCSEATVARNLESTHGLKAAGRKRRLDRLSLPASRRPSKPSALDRPVDLSFREQSDFLLDDGGTGVSDHKRQIRSVRFEGEDHSTGDARAHSGLVMPQSDFRHEATDTSVPRRTSDARDDPKGPQNSSMALLEDYHKQLVSPQAQANNATRSSEVDLSRLLPMFNEPGSETRADSAEVRLARQNGLKDINSHELFYQKGYIDAVSSQLHHKPLSSSQFHWGRNNAAHAHMNTASNRQPLDEWRKAGTARLTASDFLSAEKSQNDQECLRHGREVATRRKSAAHTNMSLHGLRDDHTTTGKTAFLPSQSELYVRPSALRVKAAPIHTRHYATAQDSTRDTSSFVSRFKKATGIYAMPSARGSQEKISSPYSYSCPALADHAPYQVNHICKPYMSKKLTQSMRSIRIRPVPGVQTFSPPLYLKCGPLLRYTGLRRVQPDESDHRRAPKAECETWRGSVMIVTSDIDSRYEPAPTLRLFPEPMELLPPPLLTSSDGKSNHLTPEYLDPIAGLPRLSRRGNTVYVKPVDDLGEAIDLSQTENDDGLFEETRTAAVPTSYGMPRFRCNRNAQYDSNTVPNPGMRKGQQVRGCRLHAERGVTFWRFNIEVQLGAVQARIAYSINDGPAVGFWVPARGQTMNVMFHSCNGFSMNVNPDNFSGPDPLWRDVLNAHQIRPFHVMIGGGDQIYNDIVMTQSPLLREWLEIRNPLQKQHTEFFPAMRDELETFYLERYCLWFSQGLFGMANSQIPMVNIWDDHDIIDGYGSYPHHFMNSAVFRGLGSTAYHYYMLFQHQSVSAETSADEVSWLTGAAPGPYIGELSRSIFLSLGTKVAFLGLDCRTERMRDEILSEATYSLVFDRCRREIIQGETKHLIVLLGVPIAYPRLVWLETLLTSRILDPIKALGKVGIMSDLLNKFDGGVEILDDLDDHWTAKNHKHERNWLVQELQNLAATKSVRITILGGDVHLAAVGQFFSNPKLNLAKDRDHRYMTNVISSAIVNTPPPELMGSILDRCNKTHHLDQETDENMIPIFTHDVDGKPRNNRRLLPRRNWCSIREYHSDSPRTHSFTSSEFLDSEENLPCANQNRKLRTTSLAYQAKLATKSRNTVRRLSGEGFVPSYISSDHSRDLDSQSSRSLEDSKRSQEGDMPRSSMRPLENGPTQRQSFDFQRCTVPKISRANAEGDLHDMTRHVDLEHGLDIVINCEVNQRNPAGTTVPYRLLIPALYYAGSGDSDMKRLGKRSLLRRMSSYKIRRPGSRGAHVPNEDHGNQRKDMMTLKSDTEEPEKHQRPHRWTFGLYQRRQYRDQIPEPQRRSQELGESRVPEDDMPSLTSFYQAEVSEDLY